MESTVGFTSEAGRPPFLQADGEGKGVGVGGEGGSIFHWGKGEQVILVSLVLEPVRFWVGEIIGSNKENARAPPSPFPENVWGAPGRFLYLSRFGSIED